MIIFQASGTDSLYLRSILQYFLVPDRLVPFLVRGGFCPHCPYSSYAYVELLEQHSAYDRSLFSHYVQQSNDIAGFKKTKPQELSIL